MKRRSFLGLGGAGAAALAVSTASAEATPGLREYVSVTDYGAVGDGRADDTPAFNKAIAAAKTVFVPDPAIGYRTTSRITIPNGKRLRGCGKFSTRIFKAFNGDMFECRNETGLEHLWLDGQGGTFTGRGILIPAGDGKQIIRSCKIDDFESYCVDFLGNDAGSQSLFDDCEMGQHVGAAAGQEAVHAQGPVTALAHPRTFIGVQTQGKRFIDLGACNNVFIIGCRIGDVVWSDDSRGVMISSTRFGGKSPMTIKGANHAITGCDVGMQITVGARCQSVTLRANTYNVLPIIDAASHPSNLIEFQEIVCRETLKVETDGAFRAFSAGDTTPSVAGYTAWRTNNGNTTTITGFDDGVDGQRIIVRCDGHTGITHDSRRIRLRGELSIPAGTVNSDFCIELLRSSGVWFEQHRNLDYLSGSASYGPPSLPHGAGARTTVTVPGAALGDFAEASFSLDLQGISMTAYVSAANSVSVRFQNESGGTLDLGRGTLRVRVRKGV
jgi:hypothetical protein